MNTETKRKKDPPDLFTNTGQRKRRRRYAKDRTMLYLLILVFVVIAVFEYKMIYNLATHRSQINRMEGVLSAQSESIRLESESIAASEKAESEQAASESEAIASAHTAALPDSASIVPAQPTAVDSSYFSDAVFIGDSRMEGFRNLSGLDQGTFLTAVGMQIENFYTTPYITTSDGTQTVLQALDEEGADYKKVYVNMGVNELGWYDWSEFKTAYAKVLNDIHSAEPDAILYVCGVFYVEESKVSSDSVSYVNNTNVNLINKYILEICEENGYYYLDVNLVMDDGSGSLISGASSDGVHIEEKYCKLWLNYLETHYIPV